MEGSDEQIRPKQCQMCHFGPRCVCFLFLSISLTNHIYIRYYYLYFTLFSNPTPVKTQLLELWSMGRMSGFRVSECQTYGRRGQRHGLNLCVSPLLLELECLCISEGWGKDKGSE